MFEVTTTPRISTATGGTDFSLHKSIPTTVTIHNSDGSDGPDVEYNLNGVQVMNVTTKDHWSIMVSFRDADEELESMSQFPKYDSVGKHCTWLNVCAHSGDRDSCKATYLIYTGQQVDIWGQ